MEKRELLYEGKAKRIFSTDDPTVVFVQYKDEATAFNGEKKAKISGKGIFNNEISSFIFTMLKEQGIESHFVQKLSNREQLVQRVQIIPLEVIVRNQAAGSFSQRLGIKEGTPLSKSIVEFCYKNDELNDPLLIEDHILELKLASPEQIQLLKQKALEINRVLQEFFRKSGIILIDFKLEFGTDHTGRLLLADEISPDTCRLWDEKTKEKLDKDVFRRDLGNLTEAYQRLFTRIGGEKLCTK